MPINFPKFVPSLRFDQSNFHKVTEAYKPFFINSKEAFLAVMPKITNSSYLLVYHQGSDNVKYPNALKKTYSTWRIQFPDSCVIRYLMPLD